jgi:hypothetical protein
MVKIQVRIQWISAVIQGSNLTLTAVMKLSIGFQQRKAEYRALCLKALDVEMS